MDNPTIAINLVPALSYVQTPGQTIDVDLEDAIQQLRRNIDYVMRCSTDESIVRFLELQETETHYVYDDAKLKEFAMFMISALYVHGARAERDRRIENGERNATVEPQGGK